ncbi:hypothetical protein [Gynurincola endophyticus]|jgi:Ni/Co efflux regulator RcnB|uniref:hypothetical protein n=1 Tax=Gynurincola endophyticus TaxID=2479004 RepID=UPI000F8D61D3|nr:hypothetical protein [Gynurincola endophyticus]
MKKLLLIPLAVVLFVATVTAQTGDAGMRKDKKAIKKELKSDWKEDNSKYNKEMKKEDKAVKKEMKIPQKNAHKEMRKLEGAEVHPMAKQAFMSDFGNVTPMSSERLDHYDEFVFVKDGITRSAFYDADAQLVGTTEIKKFTDLPMHAQQKIKEWYKDYTPAEVIWFDDNDTNDTNMILYGYEFPGQDSYFVELVNGTKKIAVHVSADGHIVDYFTRLR